MRFWWGYSPYLPLRQRVQGAEVASKSFIVAPGHEFTYPADVLSLKLLRQAGGNSKMPLEEKAQLKFKSVKEGEDCSDMPAESLAIFHERGWVLDKSETPVPQKDEAPQ